MQLPAVRFAALGSLARLGLLALVTLIGLFLLLFLQFSRDEEALLRGSLRARTIAIAGTLVEVLADTSGRDVSGEQRVIEVERALAEGLQNLPAVRWVEIFDANGRAVAHSDADRVGNEPLPIHKEFVRRVLEGSAPIEEWDDDRGRFNYFIQLQGFRDSRVAVAELVMDTSMMLTKLADAKRRWTIFYLAASLVAGAILFVGARRLASSETERESAEDLATQLGEIVESSLNEIYVFDAENLLFLQVNEGARKNLGYSADELHALTPLELKPSMSRETFDETLAPLRSGESPRVHFETFHRRKDGSTYPVEVFVALSKSGKRPAFVAIILDLTARRKAERELRQAQRMEAVGQLSAGIAHDFNNLLTVITGSLDLIRDQIEKTAAERELEQNLEFIETAADRAAHLTRQLLTFGSQHTSNPIPLNVSATTRDLLPLLDRVIREDIQIQFDAGAALPTVQMDPSHLEQVITNLVINSRDAMPEGGRLHIETRFIIWRDEDTRLHPDIPPGEYVTLTVSDTGIGIDRDDVERVFDPFFTTKPIGHGTGIGLATVHGIVKQIGGSILVESEKGHGTSFRLFFPVTATSPMPAVDAAEPGEARGNGESILVCEDDKVICELVARALESVGYVVTKFCDSTEALRLIQDDRDSFDLLITDVVMPDTSGRELASAFLARNPASRVLFMSGYASTTTAGLGNRWSAENLLEKPFSLAELRQRTHAILDQRAPATDAADA